MSASASGSADGLIEAHALHPVDTSRAKDGVWLVKVPNYLADLWLKANTDRTVGKVVMSTVDNVLGSKDQKQKADVYLITDDSLIADAGENSDLIPREHKFLVQSAPSSKSPPTRNRLGSSRISSAMAGQELVILCEEDSQAPISSNESASSSAPSAQRTRFGKRYSLFGRVYSRAECQPPRNANYMKLKALQLKAKNRARHEVRVLDKPVQTHLPVANHAFDIEYGVRKKREGKNLRREREDVLQDLFKAFEKHQYYAFKDLLLLTKQPVAYLTELLKEIAVFNSRPPHQNMWELKPEYRHYTSKEDSTA
ncbi:General transcription factor IIF subunit 2 [Echinococcus granulosus]|uniref:General transcription factor IIF subunit 2 n=1 Tax=Echinococcus granulosus TaxID=6210 RepID=U6J4Z1_ECHGR|nr:General transcription factor IIF subunit 2 [Echinococcus granulosus]EUB62625.1 General transcription factor IIF subunit 2 [Echinococcus granulosus]CDS19151.1 general transcription factor IIF polypeptide 2 [Echinococcus granulosus]